MRALLAPLALALALRRGLGSGLGLGRGLGLGLGLGLLTLRADVALGVGSPYRKPPARFDLERYNISTPGQEACIRVALEGSPRPSPNQNHNPKP